MNTMRLSPLQPGYVTRKEFNARFSNVEDSIKDLKKFTVQGFEKMEEYIDASNKEMAGQITTKIISHMDKRFDQVKTDIISQAQLAK